MPFLRPLFLALTALIPSALMAQDSTAPAPVLSVELNAADQVDQSCRLSFVLRNGLAVDVTQLTVETVLFSTHGQVLLLTLFDFGALPQNRPRVRQFQVPGLACTDLSMVLINGAETCAGTGLDAATCEAALRVQSRTPIALEG